MQLAPDMDNGDGKTNCVVLRYDASNTAAAAAAPAAAAAASSCPLEMENLVSYPSTHYQQKQKLIDSMS